MEAHRPVKLNVNVDSKRHALRLGTSVTPLDALRDHVGHYGTKKGCDQGQCSACTMHLDGQRVLNCLTLAAQSSGRTVTIVEGLATSDGTLQAVQAAFIEYGAFQSC